MQLFHKFKPGSSLQPDPFKDLLEKQVEGKVKMAAATQVFPKLQEPRHTPVLGRSWADFAHPSFGRVARTSLCLILPQILKNLTAVI